MSNLTTEKDNEPLKRFQAKISERIRDDIGDLLPDDMLQKLVSDAIQSELYRETKKNHYDSPLPWVRSQVNEVIGEKIKQYVSQQLDEHSEQVHQMVLEQVKEAFPQAVATAFTALIRAQGHNLEYHLQQIMERARY